MLRPWGDFNTNYSLSLRHSVARIPTSLTTGTNIFYTGSTISEPQPTAKQKRFQLFLYCTGWLYHQIYIGVTAQIILLLAIRHRDLVVCLFFQYGPMAEIRDVITLVLYVQWTPTVKKLYVEQKQAQIGTNNKKIGFKKHSSTVGSTLDPMQQTSINVGNEVRNRA